MTKKNQHFSWRNARDEELGFHVDSPPFEHGEHSTTADERRNGTQTDENATPQLTLRTHNGRDEGFQGGYARNEIANNRILANDELYIAPSEHPGMFLTADLFDGKNFHHWCRAVKRGLVSRNKLSIIDGRLDEPRKDSLDYMQWLKVDYLVFNWISNSMVKELARGFQNLDTSKQLWDELHKRFGKRNGPRIYKLRREIATYSQNGQSVMLYFNNLTGLWDDLALLKTSRVCTCVASDDVKADLEEEHLMQFLMGLSDSYEAIRQQILILNPLPTVSQAYAMVLQVEEQMNVTTHFSEGVDQSAMYNSQRSGYKSDQFRRRLTKEEKLKLKCEHCGGVGHLKSDCFELVGVPDWYKKFKTDKGKGRANCVIEKHDDNKSEEDSNRKGLRSDYSGDSYTDFGRLIQTEVAKHLATYLQKGGKSDQQTSDGGMNVANFAEIDMEASPIDLTGHYAFGVSTDIKKNEWIVDSGASNHMCCHIGLLTDLRKLDHPLQIFLPDGSRLWATITGNATVTKQIQLHNVLFAPEFTHNLISVGQLAKDLDGKVQFLASHCIVQKRHTDRVLGICRKKGNLYVFPHTMESDILVNTIHTHNNVEDIHHLLGHPSVSTMKHIAQFKKRFKSEDFDSLDSCDVCHQAKQQRTPFPLLNRRSKILFGLVHVDVWGPCKEENISGTPYILTIVEDFSRATWTFLFKSKGQVWTILRSFILMVRTQFGKSIQIIRSDNGSEFVNHHVDTLFQDFGIIHQKSCAYSPQQNGIVERKHKHLLQVARALMFQSKLPSRFWPYSILFATWLINRLPTAVLQWKSPFEQLFGRQPNFDTLKPFGCLVYKANISPSKSKFATRSLQCIFLGFAPHHKGFLLYDLVSLRVLVARDVEFFPSQFPLRSDSLPTLPFGSFIDPTGQGGNTTEIDDYHRIITTETAPPEVLSDRHNLTSHPNEIEKSAGTKMDSVSNASGSLDGTVGFPALRRGTRLRKPPSYLEDYICNLADTSLCGNGSNLQSGFTPPTFPYLISPVLTPTYTAFLLNIQSLKEPTSYGEACKFAEWVDAMDKELKALEDNNTWTLMQLPPGKRAIGSKWVYKVKLKSDGTVERYKARLVAKGYHQELGIDYHEVFSPVAKLVTVRLFFAIATQYSWFVHQVDINNAFLHGYLADEIYMTIPQGYAKGKPGDVCKLVKSLYGLKQASREWNHEFCKHLFTLGFVQSENDNCMFIRGSGDTFIALLVYVDDILLLGPSLDIITAIKSSLHSAFTIKDLGDAKYFLGMEIARSRSGTFLCQRKYILDLLDTAGLLGCKTVTTPLPSGLSLTQQGDPLLQPDSYRRIVGKLLYLNLTRPDISYAVQQLSQFVNNPTTLHWDAAMHVLKYLKGCPSLGLFYSASADFEFKAYCDADWGSCGDTRRSLTGYCIFLGGCLVSWRCKKQSTVSLSTAEAEYRSLSFTVRELLWISYVLKDFMISFQLPIVVCCDNKAAIQISQNQVFHERTKHLDIDCHFARFHFRAGFVTPTYVPTLLQLADLFTKSLAAPRFRFLLSKLHLGDLHQVELAGG